jgi:hypothetical protein
MKMEKIMNVKAFDSALDFVPTAAPKAGIFGTVRAAFAAISEGISLANDYKALTSHGVAPDAAVRQVFEKIKR